MPYAQGGIIQSAEVEKYTEIIRNYAELYGKYTENIWSNLITLYYKDLEKSFTKRVPPAGLSRGAPAGFPAGPGLGATYFL